MATKICLDENAFKLVAGKITPIRINREGNRGLTLSECAVFFDFDNTITPFDVIDDIVERFSINDKWRAIEEDWKQGKIGSKECLEGQFQQVRIAKPAFSQYLSGISIDEYFPKILALLKKHNAAVSIVSDSSSFIINSILKNNGIRDIKVYSNRLKFDQDKLILEFPYFNQRCPKCANCKKSHLQRRGIRDKISIYVGDGLSDVCAAESADIVFAKASLLEYCKRQKKRHVEFDTLAVVYNYLKELA